LLKNLTFCLLNRYVKDIKYRFSEKCKNYFWEWHFGNGDADALEREGNIPLREILFCSVCLCVFFCLSFSFIFVCVSVRSLEIRFVLLLMGRTKILNLGDSDCHTALLERNVCFLSVFPFVSYLFGFGFCLSVRLFLNSLCFIPVYLYVCFYLFVCVCFLSVWTFVVILFALRTFCKDFDVSKFKLNFWFHEHLYNKI